MIPPMISNDPQWSKANLSAKLFQLVFKNSVYDVCHLRERVSFSAISQTRVGILDRLVWGKKSFRRGIYCQKSVTQNTVNDGIWTKYQIYQTTGKYQRSQTELLQSVVWWQNSVRRGVCCQKSAPDFAQHTRRQSWVWTFMKADFFRQYRLV